MSGPRFEEPDVTSERAIWGDHRFSAFVVILVVVAADQLTKRLVESTGAEFHWNLGLLGCQASIALYSNSGAFLSMGSSLSPSIRFVAFTVFPLLLGIAATVIVFADRSMRPLHRICVSLIAAGAIGNAIDRIARNGNVRDFLFLGCGPVRTGVFNVADMALTTVAVVIVFDAVLKKRF